MFNEDKLTEDQQSGGKKAEAAPKFISWDGFVFILILTGMVCGAYGAYDLRCRYTEKINSRLRPFEITSCITSLSNDGTWYISRRENGNSYSFYVYLDEGFEDWTPKEGEKVIVRWSWGAKFMRPYKGTSSE